VIVDLMMPEMNGLDVLRAIRDVDPACQIILMTGQSSVDTATSGGPNPTTIAFSNANLKSGKALRVSVQADGAAFTPPSGSSIPTSNVS
jgi:CheY-like chemotaxis protein